MKKCLMYTGFMVVGILALTAGSSVLADDDDRGGNRFMARLSGAQEVPPIATRARGTLDLRIDDDSQTITFELTYAGIEGGAVTASHVHFAPRRVNGGVSAFFCGGGSKPPCPPTAGTVTGVIMPADVIGPVNQGIDPGEFNELVRAIRAGLTYVNVHSTRFGGGEIRGHIGQRDDND